MLTDRVIIGEATPALAQVEISADKRRRWLELFLVLLVAFGAPFINSLAVMRAGPTTTSYISSSRWLGAMVQETAALLVLGYVLSRTHFKTLRKTIMKQAI